MSLKISFESDIKGFERVQRALEAQEKILNQNADAVERLHKAQAGLTSQALDIKGMESLKATQNQIKNLVDSLDQLSSKRSGLKAFLSTFSEFGSELKGLNAEASGKIFESMTSQIDALKNNMRGTSELMKNLRQEIDEAKASGKGKEAEEKTKQLNELATKQMTEGDMLEKLQRSYMWRKPIGQFGDGKGQPPGGSGGMAGFLGGGTSLQRMTNIMGRLVGALKGLEFATNKYLEFREGEARGAEKVFQREVTLAQGAASGAVGRSFMERRGIGREADLLQGGFFTGANDQFSMNKTLSSTRMFFQKLWSPTKSNDEIMMEEAERLNKLDQRMQYALDMGGSFEKQIALNPRVNQVAMQYGDMTTRRFLRDMARKGITTQESIPAMQQLAALDLVGSMTASDQIEQTRNKAAIDANKSQAALDDFYSRNPFMRKGVRDRYRDMPMYRKLQEEKDLLVADAERKRMAFENAKSEADAATAGVGMRDISLLTRDPAELMMTQQGAGEFRRRVRYMTRSGGMSVQDAQERYLRDLAKYRQAMGGMNVPVEAMTQLTEFGQNIQANIVGRGANFMDVTQTAQMAMGAMAGQTQLTPTEMTTVATKTQMNLDKQIGKPMTAMSMGVDFALVRMGVKNPVDRANIAKLIEAGDHETAARLAADLSDKKGVTAESMKKELNATVENTMRFQDRVSGETDKSREIYARYGLGGRTQTSMYGVTGEMATAEADKARRAGLLYTDRKEPTLEELINAPEPNQSTMADIIRRTTAGRQVKSEQARKVESELLDLNRKIAEAAGEEVKNVLLGSVVDGFQRINDTLRTSMSEMNKANKKAPQNNVDYQEQLRNIRTKPVKGGQESIEQSGVTGAEGDIHDQFMEGGQSHMKPYR